MNVVNASSVKINSLFVERNGSDICLITRLSGIDSRCVSIL